VPHGPRRRTPGLRREEVAQLAQISVDHYSRLEQARGRHPSRAVLGGIARALRLSDHVGDASGDVSPAVEMDGDHGGSAKGLGRLDHVGGAEGSDAGASAAGYVEYRLWRVQG